MSFRSKSYSYHLSAYNLISVKKEVEFYRQQERAKSVLKQSNKVLKGDKMNGQIKKFDALMKKKYLGSKYETIALETGNML